MIKYWCIEYINVFKEHCYYWTEAYSKEAAKNNLYDDEYDVSKIISINQTFKF